VDLHYSSRKLLSAPVDPQVSQVCFGSKAFHSLLAPIIHHFKRLTRFLCYQITTFEEFSIKRNLKTDCSIKPGITFYFGISVFDSLFVQFLEVGLRTTSRLN